MTTTNTNRLALLTSIGQQILAMTLTGAVDVERATYCTAGRFTTDDIRAALKMLHAAELVDYRGGKYHAPATSDVAVARSLPGGIQLL